MYNVDGDFMKTIKSPVQSEIIIKNSRFITYLFPILDEYFNVNYYLNLVKKDHPKATHYCYGYIYQDQVKAFDDNEPSGTAGIPILSVLQKGEYSFILAIVVRYFGGIKLGAGGLVRAYSKACKTALDIAQEKELIKGWLLEIKIPYDQQKDLDYLLKDSKVLSKDFQEMITYRVRIKKEQLDQFSSYSYQIIREEYL